MRFGVSTYAFAWSIGVAGHPCPAPMDAEAFLATAAGLGAEAVQIADNMPLHLMSTEQRRRLRDQAGELRLQVEVGARGLTQGNLLQYARIAAEMGSPILRIVIDAPGYTPDIHSVETLLQNACSILEECGLRLAIENHDRLRVEEYVTLLEIVASERIGICLDTVNSLGAGQDFERTLAALAPHTINLHVKDYVIRRHPHQMGFEVTGAPAGEGMLPLEHLLTRIAAYGRCQTAVLESWPPLEATIEATIDQERSWAGQGSANLRRALSSINSTMGQARREQQV